MQCDADPDQSRAENDHGSADLRSRSFPWDQIR
jgi:hypothetical protein